MPPASKAKVRNHDRASDQTTFTWALSKELKAALIFLSTEERRTLGNYLTQHTEEMFIKMAEDKGFDFTDKNVNKVLAEHAERASRGRTYPLK